MRWKDNQTVIICKHLEIRKAFKGLIIMYSNENEILSDIASFISNNPGSDIKNKIQKLFEESESIQFIDAVNIMNYIKKILNLRNEPVAASDFCNLFAKDFNNAIKNKVADCVIESPFFYQSKLIKVLNKILEDIGLEKFYIIRTYLIRQNVKIIDLKELIQSLYLK